ncbi:type II secretion system F family protein [Gleimia sp. 6138-11-ORH1]|uniref:type II secretion system F family protein n=1 Tax=Gleimia sp. 6138-11-ORH1 TaxID=2973937 RepID=UPI002167D35E|nr:type II secretion system F family protein [Gleimia sp. 6138-11-ORH1]MCS4483984.1 type II secretion system F family protein [Gleimia sp. 6138-11-ORH1]
MDFSALPVISGTLLGVGIYFCYGAIVNRPSRLEQRVLPYVQPKNLQSQWQPFSSQHIFSWISPLWNAIGSTTKSVEKRLAIVGAGMDIFGFRLLQTLVSVLATLGVGISLIGLSTVRSITFIQWLLLTSLSFILATVIWDKLLTYKVEVFAKRLSYQVADAAELLALAISAGESIPGALNRVCSISGPQMKAQLEIALEQISQGVPVSKALRNLSGITPSPQLQRLLETLISGNERGAALSVILRDQAKDLREEAMRSLLEAGGRNEIAMLIPVVFLILPVTVVFALYPGLIALRF